MRTCNLLQAMKLKTAAKSVKNRKSQPMTKNTELNIPVKLSFSSLPQESKSNLCVTHQEGR